MDLLTDLAETVGGTAFELDVEDASAINNVVGAAAEALGGLDAVVFTSTVVPFAHIEDTDVSTWIHAFSVNAVGANNVWLAALPHLSENGVVLIASSHDVGRPRAGVSAYSASKAALDEILHSWRSEHPELSIVRVGIGPTADTEILRGADPRSAVSALPVMGGARSTSRTDVSVARRRQHAGVAGHYGACESECGSRDRAVVSAHQNHRR